MDVSLLVVHLVAVLPFAALAAGVGKGSVVDRSMAVDSLALQVPNSSLQTLLGNPGLSLH